MGGFDRSRLARLDAHFRRYVDDGRLPGWHIAVSHHGELVHDSTYGHRDVEQGVAVEADTIWRIYSMSKPITSVAAMMLYEEGAFELKDEVAQFIPSFGSARVWRGGSSVRPVTEPVTEPMRIWHLLTHTSGLTYGFHYAHPVDAVYRAGGFEWGSPPDADLAECCERWASMPLVFQPGTEWNYGVSTDVLGRVIEVASGQTLDEFFRTRIFQPLGMNDTGFTVADESKDRLAALYFPDPSTQKAARLDALGGVSSTPPAFLSGGGGLLSTTSDYVRFAEMVRRGGDLDGVRLLGDRTIAYMRQNHLPGGADLEEFGRPLFSETTFDGVGFGLGWSVVVDPVKGKVLDSPGSFGWGGAASTFFFVDPVEQVTAVFMTQLLPSSTWPIRSQLKQLIYQALLD